MKELKKEELEKIEGGGFTFWSVVGIIAAAAFIIGFFDGLARPVKCE